MIQSLLFMISASEICVVTIDFSDSAALLFVLTVGDFIRPNLSQDLGVDPKV